MQVTVFQNLVRLCFLALVILGIEFWTGHMLALIQLHMAIGAVLVVCLWIMAIIGLGARVPVGQAVVALVWGLVVIAFGMTHARLLPGSQHWIIQVLHLIVGMLAVGMSEGLARAINWRRTSGRPV